MEIEIHPRQAQILTTLLFRERARFSDLNVTKITTDHFTFHVNQLLATGLIEKTQNKFYRLTVKGKEFANRFDTEKAKVERQAKVAVLIVVIKKDKYLVQKRLKQPYYGLHGFPTGKVKWGETVSAAGRRELEEETGLKAKIKLVGVKHKMDYNREGHLLEDKYFFVMRATQPQGTLVANFEGGQNIWLSREEINKLPDLFDGVDDSLKMAKGSKFAFDESKYQVRNY